MRRAGIFPKEARAHASGAPMSEANDARPHRDLPDKVRFLSDPEGFGEGPVEIRETHMAWVFLTRRHAYKLKKPVRLRDVDFTTLAARAHDCREEMRLNPRLAASVYLALVPLVRPAEGKLALGGAGEVVDWLIKMRRLADESMLDRMLEGGRATPADLRAVGDVLAAFYAALAPVPITPAAYVAKFDLELAASMAVARRYPALLPARRADDLETRLRAFLATEGAMALADRVIARAVIEGHGDLRPEHVCLERPPVVIDCLEFSAALRQVDPMDEMAFLAMECARLGAAWAEPLLMDACARALPHWREAPRLIAFYKAVHALIRARLALLHLEDAAIRTPDKWLRQAAARLAQAETHVEALGNCPVGR